MGGDGLIVIVVALVVLVGGSQLPKIARNVGLAGKEFRKAQAEAEDEARAKSGSDTPAALPPTQTPAADAPATAAPAAGAAQAGEESITLTPSQLEAMLRAREEQARNQPSTN